MQSAASAVVFQVELLLYLHDNDLCCRFVPCFASPHHTWLRSLNPNFVVDFGAEPDGPVLAHECRYPGGEGMGAGGFGGRLGAGRQGRAGGDAACITACAGCVTLILAYVDHY
jgi:hypothetical protein